MIYTYTHTHICMYMTSEIEQMSPKFIRYPQSDFTFCLLTLGRHSTFRTLGEMHPDLQALCKEYAEVFGEVKGLPPKRSHEHQIPLIHGTEPVPWE